MSSPSEHESSWYWVFALPVVFIATAWTIDELNIDEDVYIPALVFSAISLFVIFMSRKKHARRTGQQEPHISWWPWLFVGPAMFIVITLAIDELGIDEDIYIPAFVLTFIASIIAFAKRKSPRVASPIGTDEPLQPALAAHLADVRPAQVKKHPSWFWAVLILIVGITVVSVVGIVTEADLARRRLDAAHSQASQWHSGPEQLNWQKAVALAERQSAEARRRAERTVRDAERQLEDAERRMRRNRDRLVEEDVDQLLSEQDEAKHQLQEAHQQLAEVKVQVSRYLDDARRELQNAVRDSDLDVSIDSLFVDEDGVKLRVTRDRDGQAVVARLSTEGLTVETADDAAETEADHEVVAECDEHDWAEVASEIHQVLFAESEDSENEISEEDTSDEDISENEEGKKIVVTVAAGDNQSADWQGEWQESASRPKPDWVDHENNYSGRMHRIIAITGPCKSQKECKATRDDQLAAAVADYAAVYLDLEGEQIEPWYGAARFRLPKQRLREYIKDEYYTIHQSSTDEVGDRPVIYTLLEFDEDFREKLVKTHRQQSITLSRMARAGIGTFGLFGLLAAAFGYLKLDDQSGGEKRGRLKFGVFGAIAFLFLVCSVGFVLFL